MSTFEEIREAYAEGFDAEREEMLGNAVLILLKEQSAGGGFTVTRRIEAGWRMLRHSQYYGNTSFEVADITSELGADVRDKTTHWVVEGSVIPALNYTLHEKDIEATVPPGPLSPFWKLRGKPLSRRFKPPAP